LTPPKARNRKATDIKRYKGDKFLDALIKSAVNKFASKPRQSNIPKGLRSAYSQDTADLNKTHAVLGRTIPGVMTDVADAAHPGGIADTPQHVPPGIESKEVPAPQALLEQSKSKPASPPSKAHSEPTVPGIGAFDALNGGNGQQRSATELYLEWSGHQRMNWSPGRDWSGS
jgi:hypothetical protein